MKISDNIKIEDGILTLSSDTTHIELKEALKNNTGIIGVVVSGHSEPQNQDPFHIAKTSAAISEAGIKIVSLPHSGLETKDRMEWAQALNANSILYIS